MSIRDSKKTGTTSEEDKWQRALAQLKKPVSRETSPAVEAVADTAAIDDESYRQELASVIPDADDSTPLAKQLAETARKRIKLQGVKFRKPTRTRIISVANQKGGVGKTTSVVNLSAALVKAGQTVLVIDMDPQGNASTALDVPHTAETDSIYDVLIDDMPFADVVCASGESSDLLCAPATIHLAGAEIELVSLVSREFRLKKALESYFAYRKRAGLQRIDYVFIDCPPSLGLLTINAFAASTEVVIPIQCEYYALEGLSQLLDNIQLIRRHINQELSLGAILLTMYDGRTNLAQEVEGEVRSHFGDVVLPTHIPRSVRISEAPSHQQTILSYDPSSPGAIAYLSAAKEFSEKAD